MLLAYLNGIVLIASLQGPSLDSAIQAIDALDSRLGSAAESFSVAALKARLACAEQQMAKLVAMDQGRYERWSLVERLGLAQQRLAFLRVKFREVVEIKDPYVLSSYGLQTAKVSVVGAINMLGLAKRVKAKVLQASTSEVYGDPTVHPQTEDYRGNVNPIGPRACYDEGKRCAETLFFDYRRQHNLRIKVVRIFNTYGPRMHPNDGRVVSNFIVQALRGEDITIFGDGTQTRAFCYVDDMIEGFVRMMATPDEITGPINLGNPIELPMRELAERIIALTGSCSRLVNRPLPVDDPVQRCPNITMARETLGWLPTVQLDEGLSRTIAYFERILNCRKIS